ncbi:MAG: hypothetical protein NVS3B10_00020 [Polyangiales bacterium]
MASSHGLRDVIKAISPSWLRNTIGEKYLYAPALIVDAMLERVNEGVLARFPTRTKTTSSLPYIGADLSIPQGLAEGAASYAQRLKRALDDWFYAGSARAVIAQALGYLSPVAPRVLVVNNASAWDYVPAGGLPTTLPTHVPSAAAVAPTANWNWDQAFYGSAISLSYLFRVWLILDGSTWATSTRTWASGWTWGSKTCSWGFDQPPSTFAALRAIVKLWKAQHASIPWIVITLDSSKFIPTDAPGAATLPDGNWRNWSKIVGTTRVAARFSTARYMDGAT